MTKSFWSYNETEIPEEVKNIVEGVEEKLIAIKAEEINLEEEILLEEKEDAGEPVTESLQEEDSSVDTEENADNAEETVSSEEISEQEESSDSQEKAESSGNSGDTGQESFEAGEVSPTDAEEWLCLHENFI